MSNFLTQYEKAIKLTPQKVRNDLFVFVRTLETYFADLNVEQLHTESKDIFGNPIGFYSKGTEVITNGRKKEGDPFDLKESGQFLNELFAEVQGDSLFFDTKDEKKPEVLENLLSKDIFGLSDENLQEAINEKLLPFFQNYFFEQLLLT